MKTFLAITKISLISIIKNPLNLLLGLGFPLVLVGLFSMMGSPEINVSVGILPETLEDSPMITALEEIESLTLITDIDSEELKTQLERGEIDTILTITETEASSYDIRLQTSTASPQSGAITESIISGVVDKLNLAIVGGAELPFSFDSSEAVGREYKQIDFILPGAIGFALMFSGVFTLAVDLITMREKLVFKRLFATPVNKLTYLSAEAFSRLLIGTIQAALVILIGVFAFEYTLVDNVTTFAMLMIFVVIGQVVFQGLGILAAGLSKNENSIGAIGNIITFPQLMLSGTFISLDTLPNWAQQFANIFPLTHVVSAMRQIAFEGALLSDLGFELMLLIISIVVIYGLGVRLFRWE